MPTQYNYIAKENVIVPLLFHGCSVVSTNNMWIMTRPLRSGIRIKVDIPSWNRSTIWTQGGESESLLQSLWLPTRECLARPWQAKLIGP